MQGEFHPAELLRSKGTFVSRAPAARSAVLALAIGVLSIGALVACAPATSSGSTSSSSGGSQGTSGASQYKHFTGKDVNVGAVTPISGVGDKAAYTVSALTGNVPQLYALHGDLYCGVQMNAQTSELVSSDMATTAKNEGALCNDAFAQR